MADANLTAKIIVNFLAQISVAGNAWKDQVDFKATFGREADVRTVQGGGPDVIPGAVISEFEIETPLTTDLIDTASPTPTDTKSISYYIYQIHTLGVFPIITSNKVDKNRDGDTGDMQVTGWITNVIPGDKIEGEKYPKAVLKGIIKTFDGFTRTNAP